MKQHYNKKIYTVFSDDIYKNTKYVMNSDLRMNRLFRSLQVDSGSRVSAAIWSNIRPLIEVES